MRPKLAAYLAAAIAGVCFVLIVLHAFLTDDTFITLRTVDNFIHGRGLTWNPGERVQAYTHPLWMLLLSGACFLTREFYYTTYAVSLLVSGAFLGLFVRLHGKDFRSLVLALLALTASKSFVDYGTSGLENPLLHLLLCIAYWVLWDRPGDRNQLFLLSALTAAGVLTRPDALLLFLPALGSAAWRAGRDLVSVRSVGALVAGFSPLSCWQVFSLVYYGSVLPNTFYAKLNTGVTLQEYVAQGFRYFLSTSATDPLIFFLIPLALVLSLMPARRHLLPASVACVLWLLYILRIGGDFMVGRQFTPAIVLAAMILARCTGLSRPWLASLATLIIGWGLFAPLSPWRYVREYDGTLVRERLGLFQLRPGIGDTRGANYPVNGLLRPNRVHGPNDHRWALRGMEMRLEAEADSRPRRVIVAAAIGMLPFYAGPKFHFVDQLALADPLLARFPWIDPSKSRIGHYCRFIPEGYVETLETGENRLTDPDLAAYYDQLALVVSSDRIWDWERLKTIWNLNTGRLDSRLDGYIRRNKPD